MKARSMKRVVVILGIVLIALLCAVVAVINLNDFRPMLESELSDALGRQVKLGNLGFSILRGAATAVDLSIADNPAYSRTPFLRAKSLTVVVNICPLIASPDLHPTHLNISPP